MIKIHEFYSQFSCDNHKVVYSYDDSLIENEPMLYRADLKFAVENGGLITKQFLNRLIETGWLDIQENIYIDSRSHMLMKGWYPCIPGWHHDDVPRSRKDGQPNYNDESYFAEHAIMLLNAGIAPTEFITGEFQLPDAEEGKILYKEWDARVEHLTRISPDLYPKTKTRNNIIYFFDARTFHQGTPATHFGWRYFIRATKHSLVSAENKIRKNANVYLPEPFAGW